MTEQGGDQGEVDKPLEESGVATGQIATRIEASSGANLLKFNDDDYSRLVAQRQEHGDVARFYEIPLEWQSIPLHIQSVFMMSKSKRKVVPLSPLDYIYPHLRPKVGEKSWCDNRELLQSIPRSMMEFDQPINFQTDNYSPECSFSRMDNTAAPAAVIQDVTRYEESNMLSEVVHVDDPSESDVDINIFKIDNTSPSHTTDESNSSKLNICDEHATKEEPSQVTLPLTEDSSIIPSTPATATPSTSSILSIHNIRFPIQHYQYKHFPILGQILQPLVQKPISELTQKKKQSGSMNRPEQVKEGETGIKQELDMLKQGIQKKEREKDEEIAALKTDIVRQITALQERIQKKEEDASQEIAMLTDRLEQTKREAIQENSALSTRLLQKENELTISNREVATLQERVHEVEKELERSQTKVTHLHAQMAVMQEVFKPQWLISRPEITLSQNELCNGGWGRVMQATFRKEQVAAKCLHRDNIQQVVHEMNIASKCHHPNLLKYFGATLEGDPIILTELMQTNLHDVIQRCELKNHQIVPLLRDIVSAIKYLHNLSPEPIIHGDISSSNVLLDGPIRTKWVSKLSNFESANVLGRISEQSRAPGNPTYAAPEVSSPHSHSEKMDVYSFGVLLFEICSGETPSLQLRNEVLPTAAAVWPEPYRHFVPLIMSCTRNNKDERPTMSDILAEW